ncbi:MAG: ABC transporter ATP-binding protein [Burkholderiaceae bacterium]
MDPSTPGSQEISGNACRKSAASPAPRLRLLNITRRYPGVLANDQVSLQVGVGQIHGLIGENGAGKSTLMKIAYGLVKPDAGQIFWEGKRVTLDSPGAARALGIGMVFQHFSLFESLTVTENVALVLPGARGDRLLADRIVALGDRYGLPVDPDSYIYDLSVGERQRVEIIRCLLLAPRLLILDEPTSVLTPQAAAGLFNTLRRLSDEGMSVLYISHKLDEVRQLCNEATVLRGGRVTGTCQPANESVATLSQMMLGAAPPKVQSTRRSRAGQITPVLEVTNLKAQRQIETDRDINVPALSVAGGEVIGIAGISGNGQNELMNLLSGERLLQPGVAADTQLNIRGQSVLGLDVVARSKLGLAFVPEERLGRGAVPPMGLDWNILLTRRDPSLMWFGLAVLSRLRAEARSVIEKYAVKTAGEKATADSLSGGNLQKFIVGREVMKQPDLLLVAQPTWGVDVGAAAQIRQALVDLAATGSAVLVVSEDLDELLQVSDALYVISDGQLSARIERESASIEQIGILMGGEVIA